MKYNDCMVDLETLATTPNCPVISLGAVFFDIETKTLGPTFYMALDISEQMKFGRIPDGPTLKWWMQQSGAAKKVFNEQAKPTLEVLTTFIEWYKANQKKTKIWGNGATFDISIMENIFSQYNLKCPWLYFHVMDLRTFKRFVAKGEKLQKSGINHNALDDAKSQAEYVMKYS